MQKYRYTVASEWFMAKCALAPVYIMYKSGSQQFFFVALAPDFELSSCMDRI